MKVRMYENYADEYVLSGPSGGFTEEELKEMFDTAWHAHKVLITAYAITDDGEAVACKDNKGDEWFIASDDDVGEDAIFGGYGDDECLYVGTYHGKSYYLFWSDYHTLRQYFDLSIFKRLITVNF